MTGRTWSGTRVQNARRIVATSLPRDCPRCGHTVNPDDNWVVGHVHSRATHPHLMWVPDNWRPEHRACSDKTGMATRIEKARLEGARAAQAGVFPDGHDTGSQAFANSLSPGLSPAHGALIATRSDLDWSPETMRAHPWLVEFAEVPEDASPPLWMSPPAEDAVCSYGWEGCSHCPAPAVPWIEVAEKKRLRWWQRLAITRQLEHRADGSLCWEEVDESGTRRIGKSVRLRGVATWRMTFGGQLFGERQEVVHTGSDLAVCRKVQKEAWRWAMACGLTVTKGNGKEAIENQDTGDTWLVRAQDAVYGWDTTLALGDETWDVKPDTVSEGLEPSLLERSSPQLYLTSTAHRRATSTMRKRLEAVLTTVLPKVLVMVWAARATDDPGDPAAWRAASAYWSQARHDMIAAKYEKALAGEADPEADDPDPMAGFVSQYLNIWRLRQPTQRGESLTSADAWDALVSEVPFAVPAGAAIESGLVALAYRDDAHTIISITAHEDLAAAVATVNASGYRGVATVAPALVKDPALTIRTRPGEKSTTAAAVALERWLREGVLRHDGQGTLREQVLALRTVQGADGLRVSSTAPAEAVRSAVWAMKAAYGKPAGRPRVVLPTSGLAG